MLNLSWAPPMQDDWFSIYFKLMDKAFTVLITGTSKGLGFDLTRIFLKKHPEAIIYATSRENPEKAAERWK